MPSFDQSVAKHTYLEMLGDLTIRDLELEDDGEYTCRYGDNPGLPDREGSSYCLEVTGRLSTMRNDISYLNRVQREELLHQIIKNFYTKILILEI